MSDSATGGTPEVPPHSDTDPIAILFPGQGSQAPGMGRLVHEHSPAARRVYEEASDVTGIDLVKVCFESDDDTLAETTLTQPAVVTTSIAVIAGMREKLAEVGRRVSPRLFGGHSLGLFSAAVTAEAMTFRDALLVIMERSRLMSTFNQNRPVGMASIIGLDSELVAQICEEATLSAADRVDVANRNLDTQTVISGDVSALERAMARARDLQGRVIQLRVKVSSHTPLHADQAAEFGQFIREIPFADPQRPVISNITSRPLTTGEELRAEFEAQLMSPVYWAENVREMARQGIDTFVEAGPGHVLARMVRRVQENLTAVSLDDATEPPIPISALPPDRAAEGAS